ncbi:MAG: penicillin-binding protein 1C [Anaerolineales bacterium]|jgi:1A family penicillin-binding protein
MKRISIYILIGVGLFLLCGYIYLFYDLPDIETVYDSLLIPSIRITDRDGQLLYEIIPEESGRHSVVSIDEIPDCIKLSTIAVEDGSFYQNPGVDFQGIIRAFWINLKGGEILAGGSTITQQVAKNLLLPETERTEITIRRKLRETALAWQLTNKYSKDEILSLYLNQSYYGGMAYGVEAAAQTYFGKPIKELTLAECALISGLPQAPSYYNPFTNPEAAKSRQLIVLGLMKKEGFITAEEKHLAENQPLFYNQDPYPIEAPHFIWMVKSRLDELYKEGAINSLDSIIVRTTLDLNYQNLAEEVIQRQLDEFQHKNDGIDKNVNNAALVALDPLSGEILALVGSADFFDPSIDGSVNMVISQRQPGSAFKPIVYAAALDPNREHPWNPGTMILDVYTSFTLANGDIYTPRNYDFLEHGPVSVREALGSSLNIPAVITLNDVGVDKVIHLASDLGISSLNDPSDYNLSLALGGGKVSLLELSAAYIPFANGGYNPGRYAILEISDMDGNVLFTEEKQPLTQVLDEEVAWIINDILSDDQARIIGFGANSILKLDRPAAVKTGTTTNFHDNWTVGYTPQIVVGVWVGNSDNKAMRDVTGLTGAAPIWHDSIRAFLQGMPEVAFQKPPNIIEVEICKLSGLLPTDYCHRTTTDWFIPGTEPRDPDNIHQLVIVDSSTGELANEYTRIEDELSMIVLDLPTSAHSWARAQGWVLLADYQNTEQSPVDQSSALVFLSPTNQATYRITKGLDPDSQRLSITLLTDPSIVQVSIFIDGEIISSIATYPFQIWWPVQKGNHQIWVEGTTVQGETITSEIIEIEVIEE